MKDNVTRYTSGFILLCMSCAGSSDQAQVVTPSSQKVPICDHLSLRSSPITHPAPGFALEEASFSATLLSKVPMTNAPEDEELLLVMAKENAGDNEEAIYILQTPPRPEPREYRAVYARAKEQLRFDGTAVGAEFKEAPIDPELARAIESAWGPMTLGARWPTRTENLQSMRLQTIGWGSPRYTFDYSGDMVYGQGTTMSPARGSCAALLIEIGELLIQFIDAPDLAARAAIRIRLMKLSQHLSARIAEPPPDL